MKPSEEKILKCKEVIEQLQAELEKLKIEVIKHSHVNAGNCLGCKKPLDHDYCEHCRRLWES